MKRSIFGSAVLACFTLGEPGVASADLIFNGDFEAGNVGFQSGYAYASSSTAEGVYKVATDPRSLNPAAASFGDHTTGAGLMMIVNGATTPDRTVWQQTISVVSESTYTLSGWAASWGNPGNGIDPSPADLRLLVNGTQIGSDFSITPENGQWTQFLASWNSGTSTTATIRIVDVNTEPFGNDFTLDDLSFIGPAVPEPSALASLVSGLVVLLAARWRRRTAA